jgi:uncharacterized membrane protein HdeD (DUF308 family)
MTRKKKNFEEIIEVERIGIIEGKNKKVHNVSEGFYYLLGIVIGIILMFATEEFLSTINYLFVVIFAVIAVIKIISFIMEKDYEKKNYSDMIIGIMSTWIAIFVFKYGQFLFLEMLPVLVSLLLFTMGISSLTKYFNLKRKGNLVIGGLSLLLGVLLMVIPGSIMYIFFKITGVYLLITIILDLIDYKVNTYK